MADLPSITRRALVRAIPAAGALAALPVLGSLPVNAAPENPDASLLALVEEWRKAEAAASAAWDVASPLSERARDEWARRGLPYNSKTAHILAELFDVTGATQAEDIADKLTAAASELVNQIRDTQPHSIPGIAAKFEVLRDLLGIQDDEPRADQDWDHEFFNAVGDDLKALNA